MHDRKRRTGTSALHIADATRNQPSRRRRRGAYSHSASGERTGAGDAVFEFSDIARSGVFFEVGARD